MENGGPVTDLRETVVDAGAVITCIDTVALRAALEKEFRGSHYHMTHRATLVTRVHTSVGIVGEAYAGDEDQTLTQIERIVHEEIAPAVVGLELLAAERSWQAGHPATFDILRDRRLGLVALAGVNAAIWDAIGRFLGQPLWRLWGGYRNRVPLIAIGGYYGEPLGPISEEIAAYQKLELAGSSSRLAGSLQPKTPSASKKRVRPPATTSSSPSTPTRAIRSLKRSSSATGYTTSTSPGLRSRFAGRTINAACAMCGCAAGSRSAPGRANTRRRVVVTSWNTARLTSATSTRLGPAAPRTGCAPPQLPIPMMCGWATTKNHRLPPTWLPPSPTERSWNVSIRPATRFGGT